MNSVQLRAKQMLRDIRRLQKWHPWIVVVFAVVVAGTALVIHAQSYVPFFSDDGFISLRYSQRLLDGHGLTWNDGERIEGYSNPLWVLLCAAIGATGVDLVDAARLLGQVCAIAAVFAVSLTYGSLYPEKHRLAATLLPAIFVSASGCFAVWAIGGLEATMVAGCIAWGLYCTFRILRLEPPDRTMPKQWIIAGIPLSLLCLTRSDGALVAGCIGIGVLVAGHSKGLGGCPWKPNRAWFAAVMWLMMIPVAVTLVHLAFRLSYYGAWVPNTAAVKVAFNMQRLEEGALYIYRVLWPNKGFIVVVITAAVPFVLDAKSRSRLLVMVPMLLIWSTYIASIGGDIFPARRHIIILLVVAAFFAGEGIQWFMRQRYYAIAVSVSVILACLCLYVFDQKHDDRNIKARNERWEWVGKPIGKLFLRHFRASDARLAVEAAGALPYYSQLTTIDMLGLNDRYIAAHPPPDFGKGVLAHDLGNGAYVLSREPDLVVFGFPSGRAKTGWRSGREMLATRSFSVDFSLIKFEAGDPVKMRSTVYVRRNSPRLGVSRSDGLVVLPGFLFTSAKTVAREDDEGRLGASVPSSSPAELVLDRLEPGRWELSVRSSGVPLQISALPDNEKQVSAVVPSVLSLAISGTSPKNVKLNARPTKQGLSHIREVVLERVSPKTKDTIEP
ncbi:MAG: hypothetical protein FWD57_17360 [Polyangiaceae bacterium]|nr:hypothetical protein [Polyangiaceae bacterium]